MTDQHLVDKLDALVQETFALWDPGWVTFNWRNYTYDHTRRVQGLALNLCTREGGDSLVTNLSALLHDITKPYDGEYVVDSEGKRIIDADGYWLNALRPPQRQNAVTELYDRLHLAGKLHNESGAEIANTLLSQHGVEQAMRVRVAQTIRDHLRPPDDAPIESLCLYDADTIDANIGLPAFVRNIYINLHFHEARNPGVPLFGRNAVGDEVVLLDYLHPYITDRLPGWATGKQRDFIPRLLTEAGRELASQRLERLMAAFDQMGQELAYYDSNRQHGCLAILLHYMGHREDPSIAAESRYLSEQWLPSNNATPAARLLVEQLAQEMAGDQ